MDDSNVNIDGNPTNVTPTPTHNVANKKDGAKYLRKHITSLTTVPPGMGTKEWLHVLMERPTGREAFLSAIDHPKQQVLSRYEYEKLELDGRKVETMDYADDKQRAIITNALKQFDSDYNPSYSSKSQLNKMTQIAAFIVQ